MNLTFEQDIEHWMKAGQPGLYIQTSDQVRTRKALHRVVSRRKNCAFGTWDRAKGIRVYGVDNTVITLEGTDDPLKFLKKMPTLKGDLSGQRYFMAALDLHLAPIDREMLFNRLGIEAVLGARNTGSFFAILAPTVKIPPEWEKLFVVVKHRLPEKEELREKLFDFLTISMAKINDVVTAMNTLGWKPDTEPTGGPNDAIAVYAIIPEWSKVTFSFKRGATLICPPDDWEKWGGVLRRAIANLYHDDDEINRIVDAAAGLTEEEAETFFARSYSEEKKVSPRVVTRLKAKAFAKSGLAEIIETDLDLESVGGLDLLKAWLLGRRSAFTEKAREYGLTPPKGILLVGMPGCGKSLVAKVTSNILGIPCLKLDMSKIYAPLLGQTGRNMNAVLDLAEAMSPVVLWLDEIEKALGGSQGSSTDGGASQRILGTFLNWMQEKTKTVFVVATANRVAALPPELLRKGRFDEIFSVVFPNRIEREQVLRIHLTKKNRDPDKFNLGDLVDASHERTSSEIEEAIVSALYTVFPQNRDIRTSDIETELEATKPLSKLMPENVAEILEWCRSRARPATTIIEDDNMLRLIDDGDDDNE